MTKTLDTREAQLERIRAASSRLQDFLASGAIEITPQLQADAELEYEKGQPAHQCYWNCRFFLAVHFDLPKEMQRLAAWCAVNNGLNDYWEWRTHAGYSVITLLRDKLNIADATIPAEPPKGLYSYVEDSVLEAIARKFNLPTRRFGLHSSDHLFTNTEEAFREKALFTYPYYDRLY